MLVRPTRGARGWSLSTKSTTTRTSAPSAVRMFPSSWSTRCWKAARYSARSRGDMSSPKCSRTGVISPRPVWPSANRTWRTNAANPPPKSTRCGADCSTISSDRHSEIGWSIDGRWTRCTPSRLSPSITTPLCRPTQLSVPSAAVRESCRTR